jgi:hypothetical protein
MKTRFPRDLYPFFTASIEHRYGQPNAGISTAEAAKQEPLQLERKNDMATPGVTTMVVAF